MPWENTNGRVAVEAAELLLVLEGIEFKGARQRDRWTPRSSLTRIHTSAPMVTITT